MGKRYVYQDTDSGLTLVFNNVFVQCSACGQTVPMAEVGMRRMGKTRMEFRNQPRCGKCRRTKSTSRVRNGGRS
ncbi:MAG: hypothetical protein MUF66_10295 [Gammaproteobacteria bacterium]|nr:hypothetical protein [Gammaproteobacteria bacterium]